MGGRAAIRRGRKRPSLAPKILPVSQTILSDQPQSHRATEKGRGRQGDKETGRRGEGEIQRQGELNSPSPCLPFSLSPPLLVSLSPPLSLSLCLHVSVACPASQSYALRFRRYASPR